MTRKVHKMKKSLSSLSLTIQGHCIFTFHITENLMFFLCLDFVHFLRIDKVILSKEIYNNINKRRKL